MARGARDFISTQAADALKTLNPDQIQQMLKEVEDMSPEERERLKGMGINPDMLKMSMKVMNCVETGILRRILE